MGPRRIVVVPAAVLGLLGAGCTTVRMTPTTRSSVEQRLLTASLERAAAELDIRALAGKRLKLELFGLTDDQVFAREFLRSRLESRGVRVVSAGEADATFRVFATALAVDTASTLLGLPAMQAPVLAVPIPEVALFKWDRNRGHAQFQSYVYDPAGRLLEPGPSALGQAKYDRFTIMIFISFTITDLEKRATAPP